MKRGFGENGDEVTGRSRLAWFPALAMKLVAFFSDVGYGGGTETCTGNPNCRFQEVRCCFLACANIECPHTGTDFSCPPPYKKTFWTCFEGTKQIACGECTCTGTSCAQGPFGCSIAMETGGARC